jgi:hypothetical protein
LIVALVLPSCGRPAAASFDGHRAYEWIVKQVAFGPRAPGTAAHDSCFTFLHDTMKGFAPVVEADTFHYFVPKLGREVRLFNLLARFEPAATQRVLLGAHWDTRPWADQDPDTARRNQPVLGANDGGSGVAVLLELARMLHERRPAIGVDLALFDGEDLGTNDHPDGWFRGSKQYVAWRSGEPAPIFVIVVDMVGKRDLELHWEGNSYERATNIVDLVWGVAQKLNVRSFRSDVRHTVFDDHVPFLNAGIPAIVLIDLSYPEWHTTRDDLSAIDPESLTGVGRVLHSLVTDPTYLGN